MERIDDLISRLKELKDATIAERELATIEMAICELENGFNPADGVWIVKDRGRDCAKFAELSEVETLDVQTLAKLEMRRLDAARALTETIEATRRTMEHGETWWTVAPQEIINKVFRAIIK